MRAEASGAVKSWRPVSYTHLDVYKRQVLGQENTWVTVPVDFAKLRTGLNRIIVDSNVDNVSNFSDNSLDLYFTDSTKGDSAVSTDGMVNWMDIDNRVCNISLELRNASSGNWEKVTKEEFNTFEHTVIGQFLSLIHI